MPRRRKIGGARRIKSLLFFSAWNCAVFRPKNPARPIGCAAFLPRTPIFGNPTRKKSACRAKRRRFRKCRTDSQHHVPDRTGFVTILSIVSRHAACTDFRALVVIHRQSAAIASLRDRNLIKIIAGNSFGVFGIGHDGIRPLRISLYCQSRQQRQKKHGSQYQRQNFMPLFHCRPPSFTIYIFSLPYLFGNCKEFRHKQTARALRRVQHKNQYQRFPPSQVGASTRSTIRCRSSIIARSSASGGVVREALYSPEVIARAV